MNVGLGKFDGIDGRRHFGGHNGNQLGRGLFGRSGGSLPVLAPPGPLIQGQVAVPPSRIQRLLWIRPNRNPPAQIADECYL